MILVNALESGTAEWILSADQRLLWELGPRQIGVYFLCVFDITVSCHTLFFTILLRLCFFLLAEGECT